MVSRLQAAETSSKAAKAGREYETPLRADAEPPFHIGFEERPGLARPIIAAG
jgi:hypothetical protein